MRGLFVVLLTLGMIGCSSKQAEPASKPNTLWTPAVGVGPTQPTEPPRSFEELVQQAWQVSSTGNYGQALVYADRAVRERPRSAEAHYLRGAVLSHLQRDQEAEAALSEAIRLNPRLAGAYNTRALVRAMLDKNAECLADADMGVRLNPAQAIAQRNREKFYLRVGMVPPDIMTAGITYRAISVGTPTAEQPITEVSVPVGRTREFRPAPDWTCAIAFSPDGKSLVAVGESYPPGGSLSFPTVILYDAATGRARGNLGGHKATVRAVVFSRDGSLLATAGDDGTVRLWNAATARALRTLNAGTQPIHAVVFSTDGQRVIAGDDGGKVTLWDTATGTLQADFAAGQEPVRALAMSPDGKTLAIGGGFHQPFCLLWDMSTGQILRRLQGHIVTVTALAYAPNGKTLATGSSDHTVRLWDPTTGRIRNLLHGHGWEVGALAFSPDGHTLASADRYGNRVYLWNVTTGRARGVLNTVAGAQCYSLAFSPDGQWLATGGYRMLTLWDVTAGTTNVLPPPKAPRSPASVTVLRGHAMAVSAVAYSPDGRWLASGSLDRTVRLWDAHRLTLAGTLPAGHVRALAFSPDSKTLAVASALSGQVAVWDVIRQQRKATLSTPGSDVEGLAFAPDGTVLVAACNTADEVGSFVLWDPQTGRELDRLGQPGYRFLAVAFSHDGKRLAAGGLRVPPAGKSTVRPDGFVSTWDWTSRKLRRTLEDPNGAVRVLAFAPDSSILAWGDAGTVNLWTLADDKRTLFDFDGPLMNSLAFSPDSRLLAIGHSGSRVCIWDRQAGVLAGFLAGHTAQVQAVAFAPDGSALASGSDDGTVRIWKAPADAPPKEGSTLARYRYDGAIYALAMSPDNSHLALAGTARTVMLWDLHAPHSHPVALPGHTQQVFRLAFSPDGKHLASASASSKALDDPGEIRLWDVASGKQERMLARLPGAVEALVFRQGLLVSCHRTQQQSVVCFWQPENGKLLARLPGRDDLFSVTISPDGKILAAGGTRKIYLYDLPPASALDKLGETLVCRATLETPHLWVSTLAFTRDGKMLGASGTIDRTTTLWDVIKREQVAQFPGSKFAFSADDKLVSTAATNHQSLQPLFWDVATHAPIALARCAHCGDINVLAVCPVGQQLVTAGRDGHLLAWDMFTGRASWTFPD